MNRRRFLACSLGGFTTAIAACSDIPRPMEAEPTETSDGPEIPPKYIRRQDAIRVGDATPDCPQGYLEGSDKSWRMNLISKETLNTRIDSLDEAHEWGRKEHENGGYLSDDHELVVGLQEVKWKNGRHDIAERYGTDNWYAVGLGPDNLALLIPAEDNTTVVWYTLGAC